MNPIGLPQSGGADIELEGRDVSLTSLGRVLWPSASFTKGQMLDYYLRVAPALLPHLEGRPLTLGRFPGGVDAPGFAQTECRGRPAWRPVRAMRLRSGEERRFCLADDKASLAWLANQSAIELHTFLARGPRLEQATSVAFDLDPGRGRGLLDCCRVAVRLREVLDTSGLASYVKTTGSRGLHVLVPLGEPDGYDRTKSFARERAGQLTERHPKEVTAASLDSSRPGRVFIDWSRNDERQTLIAPYSLRSSELPRVSTPVAWEEIESAVNDEDHARLLFMPEEVLARVERHGDL